MGLGALALGVPHPTYDDGRNLDILYHLSHGQGQEFWHHGSPLFYTFWLPWYELGASYPALVWANGLLGLLGGWLLLRQIAGLATPWAALSFVAWAWLPVSQTNLAAFTIEAAGLLWLAFALRARQRLWQGIWVACACLWNYKLALAGGVVLAWHLATHKEAWMLLRRYAYGLAIPAAVLYFLFLAYAGPALWLRPMATYAGLLGRDANPAAHAPGLDIAFYLRYFWGYGGTAFMVVGMVGAAIYTRRKGHHAQIWLVLAYLLAAHLLPKAPRMVWPVLPLLAGYAAWWGQALPRANKWGVALALLPVGAWPLAIAYVEAWQLQPQANHFSQILQNPTKTIATPPAWEADTLVAFGSTLPQRIGSAAMPVRTVMSLRELPLTPHWLLLDGTSLYAGLAWPDSTWLASRYDRVAEGVLPGTNATQWFEHAEYRGLPYRAIAPDAERQGLAARQVVLYHSR